MSQVDALEPTRLPDGEVRLMRHVRQSPTIGRVVLFKAGNDEQANGAKEYVAIIGQVFLDPGNDRPYCNLLVFPPFQAPRWEGSVQEFDTVSDVFSGGRSWRWPPREPHKKD